MVRLLVAILIPAAALATIYDMAYAPTVDCYNIEDKMICFDQDNPPQELDHPNPDNPRND